MDQKQSTSKRRSHTRSTTNWVRSMDGSNPFRNEGRPSGSQPHPYSSRNGPYCKYASEHGKEEVKLPEEFKCHTALFSDEEANKFPPTWGEGDHKIVLLDTAPTRFNCKVYPLSRNEQEAEDKFLDENLAKGYIAPLDSPYGFSTFMVPKKDSKEKRYIIDYRPLNNVT